MGSIPELTSVLGGVRIDMGCMNLVTVISRYTWVPVTLMQCNVNNIRLSNGLLKPFDRNRGENTQVIAPQNVAKLLCVASGQSYGYRGSALFEGCRHLPSRDFANVNRLPGQVGLVSFPDDFLACETKVGWVMLA